VLQDFVLAHMWLNLAASNAPNAQVQDTAVTARDFCATLMTPGQIAEAQLMAREWKPK